jgi:predicted MFS family arabinose efflux permease
VWVLATIVLLAAFVVIERRAPEPILPVDLFATPVIARSLAVVFLVGVALFGAIAFIPLFVQAVRGGTATQAGQAITPLFLGWVIMSIAGARATVLFGYRTVSITGSVLMTIGFVGLTLVQSDSPHWVLLGSCTVIGAGMGTQMLSLLLAVQHGVDRSRLGIATALNQFSRSIGAAIGVAAMGAVLARGLSGLDLPGGANALAANGAALSASVREQFATALHQVFVTGAIVSAAGLFATLFLPSIDFSRAVSGGAGEQMLQAEMTNLEPEDEPVAVPD